MSAEAGPSELSGAVEGLDLGDKEKSFASPVVKEGYDKRKFDLEDGGPADEEDKFQVRAPQPLRAPGVGQCMCCDLRSDIHVRATRGGSGWSDGC